MRPPPGNYRRETGFNMATDDAARMVADIGAILERAAGVPWYEQHGSDIDLAALTLCRIRRASAGERGGPQRGDEVVRAVLSDASPEVLVWLASRAISYMDENGYPEAVELWFPDPVEQGSAG